MTKYPDSPRHPSAEEIADGRGDFPRVRFQRKMAGVVEMHDGIGVVACERVGALWQEERIVLPPDGQRGRPSGAEILLKLGIERDVVRVVQEQVELDLIVAWPSQERGVERVPFRRHQRGVRDALE